MKQVAVLFALVLIARNNLFFNAPFEVLRGLSLLLVALMGFYGILTPRAIRAVPAYWPQLGYMVAICLSLAVTEALLYVGFQTASVVAVLLFSIACAVAINANQINTAVLNATFYGYLLIIVVSLVLFVVNRSLVYEVLYAGELRFRGIFPKAGLMGASAGVLTGLCLFWKHKPLWLRGFALVCALICLALTQSRTFWVAGLIAGVVTASIYFRHGIKLIVGAMLVAAMLGAGVYVADIKFNGKAVQKFARLESVANLTGRIDLWNKGLDKFLEHPILGLGLSAGSSAFVDQGNVVGLNQPEEELTSSRSMGKTTLHSGYMQALLDLGAVGTFFYVCLITIPIWRLYRKDKARKHPTEFYLLIFLAVANLSENIVYAVTVFNSVLFFMQAAFAMNPQVEQPQAEATRRKPRALALAYPPKISAINGKAA